jgi:hypothetical protein
MVGIKMNANEKASKDLAIRYETELVNTEMGLLIVKMVDGEGGAEEKSLDYYL